MHINDVMHNGTIAFNSYLINPILNNLEEAPFMKDHLHSEKQKVRLRKRNDHLRGGPHQATWLRATVALGFPT